MVSPQSTRTTAPNGTLLQWKLRQGETGTPTAIMGYARPTVHVEGTFHGASVLLLGAQAINQRPVPIVDRNGDALTIDDESVLEMPATPAFAAPRVDGGDDETDVTITIFLPD